MNDKIKGIFIGIALTLSTISIFSFITHNTEDTNAFYLEGVKIEHLYRNTENTVRIQIPGVKKLNKISYEIKGGTLEKNKEQGVVKIIPQKREVTLTVFNKNKSLGELIIPAHNPPKPEIKLLLNGKPFSMRMSKRGYKIAELQKINWDVTQDHFFSTLVKSTGYEVSKYSINLARGRKPILQQSNKNDLTKIKKLAEPGDRLIIMVDEISTYKNGEKKTERITPFIQTIPLS